MTVTVNGDPYRAMLNRFLFTKIEKEVRLGRCGSSILKAEHAKRSVVTSQVNAVSALTKLLQVRVKEVS